MMGNQPTLREDFDRSASLEEEFASAIGEDQYQRLLDEKWLPFQGSAHLKLSQQDAVAREVAEAREFLSGLVLRS